MEGQHFLFFNKSLICIDGKKEKKVQSLKAAAFQTRIEIFFCIEIWFLLPSSTTFDSDAKIWCRCGRRSKKERSEKNFQLSSSQTLIRVCSSLSSIDWNWKSNWWKANEEEKSRFRECDEKSEIFVIGGSNLFEVFGRADFLFYFSQTGCLFPCFPLDCTFRIFFCQLTPRLGFEPTSESNTSLRDRWKDPLSTELPQP